MSKRSIKDAVLALYRKHPTMRRVEMAARLGFPSASISVVLQRAGLTQSRPGPRPKSGDPRRKYQRLQDWEKAAIEGAYADGEKLEALAAMIPPSRESPKELDCLVDILLGKAKCRYQKQRSFFRKGAS